VKKRILDHQVENPNVGHVVGGAHEVAGLFGISSVLIGKMFRIAE
jgi:hypothetical protein